MIPIDPKDIQTLRPQRNAELEKYIIDECNGDISFLYHRKKIVHDCQKSRMHIKNFFLYITGRK